MMMHSKHQWQRRECWTVLLACMTLAGCAYRRPANDVRRHDGDVLAAGRTPEVSDSTPGDAMLTGGDIRFSGATGSDYVGAGRDQHIGGRIHGSLRAAGGNVVVTSTVDRNATVAGGQVDLDSGATIGRNAYLAGAVVRVEGNVRQALTVAGGTVVLDGPVAGDVEAYAKTLSIGPHARIMGNLRYRVRSGNIDIDPAAHVGSMSGATLPEGRLRHLRSAFGALWLLGFLLAGLVTVALFPRVVAETALSLERTPIQSILLGVAWLIVVPVACVILAFTVLGLPLALVSVLVYILLVYLGHVTLSIWIGRRILGRHLRPGAWPTIQSFVLGGIVLVLVRLVPLVGQPVVFAASLFGVGACLIELRRLRRPQPYTGPVAAFSQVEP